jgi:hypothetical protein
MHFGVFVFFPSSYHDSFQTPALLTSACSPLTCFSNLSTTVSSFLVGLLSGLGISIVFDLLGRNGIGVEGLELKNYFSN